MNVTVTLSCGCGGGLELGRVGARDGSGEGEHVPGWVGRGDATTSKGQGEVQSGGHPLAPPPGGSAEELRRQDSRAGTGPMPSAVDLTYI